MLLATQDEFQTHLFIDDAGSYCAQYDGFILRSVFQPIFDKQMNIFGYEALLRIQDSDDQTIRPDLFFSDSSRTLEQILNIERLSRVIHIRNFSNFAPLSCKLFLNVLPESAVLLYTSHLPDINAMLLESRISTLNLSPQNIVFELVEFHYQDEKRLINAIEMIKEHDFFVAIDDYGSEASSAHRVSQLNPNVIKIDRELLLKYEAGVKAPLLSALSIAKKQDALTIVEGVETPHQYELMKKLNIGYFQGFLLGKPLPLHEQNHQAA
ncbi:EAL domain-containing protein [Aliivibrio fischeri]|uniref:EAL domain-containing protein n=1 Tax=Aliivibrio fischeri TaxID=668 RepID=A0A844P6A0_ALIFS|nr:EAL domain-containing protein [Aliivibrio fischeri]MUK50677.1 EAL domain-containing protein [Aliivibrio fischeri]